VPPAGSSSADRLWKARVGVGVFCLILGIVLFASLKPVAGGFAVVALIIFAAGWSMPTITYRRKIAFGIVSLALIVGAESVALYVERTHETERQQQLAQLEAQKEAESHQAAQQTENAFKSMTPAQHLSAAESDMHVGASEDQIADGMKHLDAISGTPMDVRAKALRARYEAEKAKADKAAAAEAAAAEAKQHKEDAQAQEAGRITFAKTVENQMLDQGFNFDVVTVGAKHTTLRMKWALASKVAAHQISENTQMFETARELGFKRMELTDGFDFTWSWNLQ
jgi:hypothetical protein